jgi:hypothetical protein
MKSNNSQSLWTNLTETQSEAVNGGQVEFNSAFFSKLTDQSNVAAIIASGNAIGNFNSAGVTSTQVNVA